MELYGRFKKISGREVTIELSNDIDLPDFIRRVKKSNGLTYIEFQEPGMITDDQRKKIYALVGDIADYTGYSDEEMMTKMKFYYMAEKGCTEFSLSRNSVSMKFASDFIEYIIEWCFKNEIPFKYREYHLAADISRILFIYAKHRACFVCGKSHADLAHVETVGMGRNRKKIDHRKYHVMTLCRTHHIEQHKIGIQSFMNKYHLAPITLDEQTIIDLNLMTKSELEEFKRGEENGRV